MADHDRSNFTLGPGQWDVNWSHLEPYERLGVEPSTPVEVIELHYREAVGRLDLQLAAALAPADREPLQQRREQLTRDMVQIRAAREGTEFVVTGTTRDDPPAFSLGAALMGAVIVALVVAGVAFYVLEIARSCTSARC
jgi:hypothetical protein